MSDQDSIFFRNFSILVAALAVLAIVLVLISVSMQNKLVANVQGEADRTQIQKSIKPVATVNSDPNAVVETAPAEVAAAFDGSLDGEMIYNTVCAACHGTGAGGAPKLTTAEWDNRMEKGMEALISNAVAGFMGEQGLMPAKGGRADLTEEQVKVTVEYMTSNLQ